MRLTGEHIRLSATDLANHLGCAHLTAQSRAVAEGRATKPFWDDPLARLLRERGAAHERAYLAQLRAHSGLSIVEIAAANGDGTAETAAAMRAGADVIYQAPVGDEHWYGRADFLQRVELPSALGSWSYEVVDAKLATRTRAGTILQLCVYSDLVARIQDRLPEHAYVVAPHRGLARETHRLADYAAYYRLIKRRLTAALGAEPPVTYPHPVEQCAICGWWAACDARRRADDHLSYVAGISRLQIKELARFEIATLERLANVDVVPRPERGSREALTRIRDQARIQWRARAAAAPQIEILQPLGPEHGFALLPAPSRRDVFLDLEGDRLAPDGGREYLFGYVRAHSDEYTALWAADSTSEKRAFEAVIDSLLAAFRAEPQMHCYHFGAYEPAALKRLSGRYATRETELDTLLRAELFVDLHAVVRHALRASVESYSIKELEPFYGLAREQDLRAATLARRAIEWAIETEDDLRSAALAAHVAAVERYNREDCVSARELYRWLESLRAQAERERGAALPRPELKTGAASEALEETAAATQRVMAELLRGVPVEPQDRTGEQAARWLMAHLLEWHRREDKAAWWEYYRLCDLPLEDYADERSALAGLAHVGTIGGTSKRPIQRYSFPAQDHDLRRGDHVCVPPDGQAIGEIVDLDVGAHTIDVQHATRFAALRPERIFVRRNVPSGGKPAVLLELGRWIAAHGVDAPGEHRAARDLLLRRPPRTAAPAQGVLPFELPAGARVPRHPDREVAAALEKVFALDHGVLPIQGPPGTGKTFTGSHVIFALLCAGKRVGVTAVSHEVIRNLLAAVCSRAAEAGATDFRCLHKGRPKDGNPSGVDAVDDNERIAALFSTGDYRLLGGTAWLWARPEFRASVDVLFIDEAGQMSLADVLAVANGAASLVLLGDPQQLEQPQQASHPPGTGVSALEHILAGAKTIGADRGLFLDTTRRLHPSICAFTSEVFYEGKLASFAGLDWQAVVAPVDAAAARYGAAGLVHVPVAHAGNQARAPEEVTAIEQIVAELTAPGVQWRDRNGALAPRTRAPILIVAPYNAQVTALGERLAGVRIGTVDKFQGQQAPVVIVSLTTSTPEDAPRGMQFLYSGNRLNVATSRAQGLCILVGSPALFEPDCRAPEQMRLANAFCRYVELARTVTLPRPAR